MECNSNKTNALGCGSTKDKCSGAKNIEELVKCYKKEYGKNLQSQLDFYKGLFSLDEAIQAAAQCRFSTQNNKHPHQYRLKKSIQTCVKISLNKEKLTLSSFSNFQRLFNFLEEKIGKIDGVGPLMTYDTALRLGAYLNCEPTEIYLHAGTRKGAEALKLDYKNKIIKREKFPEPIQQLKAYEIEDFLCIFKDKLKSIKDIK